MTRDREQEVFVGRDAERALFAAGIARAPGPDGSRRLIHVHGVAGVGKSTLLLYWQATARAHGAPTAMVDASAVCGVAKAMQAIGAELGFRAGRLEGFGAGPELDEGQGEADGPAVVPEGQPPAPGGQDPTQSPKGASAPAPGVAVVPWRASPTMIGRPVDWARVTERDQRPRERGTDEHDADTVARLSTAFVTELVRLARQQPFLVLFFDTWERSGEFLDAWVRALLLDRFGPLPGNIIVVLAGRDPLDESDWTRLRAHVTEVPLEPFTDRAAGDLLAARGVTDEAAITSVLDTALGLPLLLDMLAGTRPAPDAADESAGAPVDIAVDRYLDRIDDIGQRDTVLGCSLPLRCDEEIFRTAFPAAESDLFPWLRAQPFVTDRDGYVQYHDVVRTSMLRRRRASSPQNWSDDHTRLADAFADLRAAREANLAADKRWADGTWRGHRLNETYHRLCAHPAQRLTAALEETIHAAGQDLPTLRRWADLLTRAGSDSDAPAVTDWGRRLTSAAAGGQGVHDGLTALLTAPDLSPAARASAHLYRGRYLHHADRLDDASAELGRAIDIDPTNAAALEERGVVWHWLDFDPYSLHELTDALELDPGLVRSHAMSGVVQLWRGCPDDAILAFDSALALDSDIDWVLCQRGLAHLIEGHPGPALADLDRALELDPAYEVALAVRAMVHEQTGRLDEAVADLSRAVELDPGFGWALGRRGAIHRQAGRTAQALADLDRALELDPKDDWALAARGVLHGDEGRSEAALADLNRALELDPRHLWALNRRGEVHREAGLLEEALADVNRALELSPEDESIIAERGAVHAAAGRPEEALADLNQALEIDPDYTWALGERAQVHLKAGRPEEALADLDLAVALDLNNAWAVAQRGVVHRKAGRLEDALADLDRAVGLNADDAWILSERALVHMEAKHPQEALADLDRVVELDPEDGWAFAQRGAEHRQAGRLEEALADMDRAVELDPQDAWAVAERGVGYSETGRPEEALAELNRALELDPEFGWAFTQRGVLHREARRLDEALADLDRALELDPESDWVVGERGYVHQLAGRLDESVTDFTRAIELNPLDPWDFAERGHSHRRAGRYEEALTDLNRAVELDPAHDMAFAYRGETHRLAGRPDDAVADFTRALEIDPSYDFARQQRALTHQTAGRLEQARADLRHLLSKDDVDIQVRLHLVVLDSREHGPDAHREDWRTVLDLADQDDDEDVTRFAALLRPLLVDRGADIETPTRRLLEVTVDQEGVDDLMVWLDELEAVPGDHVPEVRRLRQRLHDHRARL